MRIDSHGLFIKWFIKLYFISTIFVSKKKKRREIACLTVYIKFP